MASEDKTITAANTNRAAPIRAATETATLDANGTAPFTATETAANHRDRNRAATARERFSNPARGGAIGNEREIVLNSSEPRVGIDGAWRATLLQIFRGVRTPICYATTVKLIVLAAAVSSAAWANPGLEFYETKVRPVLVAKCYACHHSKLASPMAGLRFDDASSLASMVTPKNADSSRLIQAVRYQTKGMPPTGRMPQEEVDALVRWVEMGAPVPEAAAPRSAAAKAIAAKEHWAWQPLQPGKGSIDGQVRARLEANGLSMSPSADHRTLIRRLSFDLTGLPPKPAEYAWTIEQAAERYLASPHYGERWARYWMDVARYADTGFLSRAFLVSFGYRDWLISALNRDIPYDRFVALQLAADQMGVDKPEHAALGFLSLGANPNRPTDLPDVVDDRIDLVSRGLMGVTVACARCHDHKYDPIPTRDYYSLYGVFANTRYGVEPVKVAPLPEFYEKRAAERKQIRENYIAERLRELRAEFREPKEVRRYLEALWEGRHLGRAALDNLGREKNLNSLVLSRWASRLQSAPQWKAAAKLDDPPVSALIEQILRGPDAPPDVPVEDFASIQTEGDANTTRDLQWQYEEILNDAAYRGSRGIVLGAQDRPEIKPAFVFVRGNQNDLGDPVGRCFPSVLSRQANCFESGTGRLELARAITSERNPIAARVAVNRVWQKLFGEGLVRTPSDFGVRGDLPTHPELLDSLAAEYRKDGWSTKRLIKRIVLSQSYRQSSADRAEARRKDPENKLLWRMNRRRLDFEALRDSMLAVAGKLDPAIGGQPVSIVAVPADTRRTMYAMIERERPLALLKTFDVADPEQHSPQRYQTTVPQQGLFLLNSPFMGEMARSLAGRARDLSDLYQLTLGRKPAAGETARAETFWRDTSPGEPAPEPVAWQYGTAAFDPETGKVTDFRPFRFFTGKAWQNASAGVDARTGVARLTASGGAPGDDLRSAAVRRWISPVDGKLDIKAKLAHNVGPFQQRFKLSNGIRGWIVSSRQGVLGKWRIDPQPPPKDHLSYKANPSVDTGLTAVAITRGEIIDFIVDSIGDYEADGFSWAPKLTAPGQNWDAQKDFSGPVFSRLTPREQLAQVLLLTNEFAFLD